VKKEESHPCYFCGHLLPLKNVDKTECKTCGVMLCPKCKNCLCTITDLQYSTLIQIHQKYCCNLPKYSGFIQLKEPYDRQIVRNFVQTLNVCYKAEKENGNI
jgi:hypothetical protein